MLIQLKRSVRLLLCLGLLFSIPISAKTFSAHGALPAVATGVAVIALVCMGPISFALSGPFENVLFGSTPVTSPAETALLMVLGAILLFAWRLRAARVPGHSAPFVLVTCWSLLGIGYCLLHVLQHIA
ncbi:MAG: hypothetical protein Hals2KO_19660 [Halioglobus sp.]